jgi:hypothetical protein
MSHDTEGTTIQIHGPYLLHSSISVGDPRSSSNTTAYAPAGTHELSKVQQILEYVKALTR